jgi:hypothetical protein
MNDLTLPLEIIGAVAALGWLIWFSITVSSINRHAAEISERLPNRSDNAPTSQASTEAAVAALLKQRTLTR